MLNFIENLRIAYANEYKTEYTNMSENYLFTKPKIYDAGEDLSKRWYVYFSYRNPQTGKLERQAPVYLSVNRIKTLKERKYAIKKLRDALEEMLKNGHIPTAYQNNKYQEVVNINIEDAVELALKNAKSTMKESSFKDYQYRLKKFQKWLNERQFYGKLITQITRKTIVNYLNEVLQNTSAKNRNNTRATLSIFYSFLEQNEYVAHNLVENIKVLETKAHRHKTYTYEQEQLIFKTLEKEDKQLLLFIKFISYNFLRPIEVCRLKVKNIHFKSSQLYVETKTQSMKVKLIPKILMDELYFLSHYNKEDYIFTPMGVNKSCTSEVNRRDYWTKRFKKIKDKLGLNKDYTIYSFRHTFITKLYRQLRQTYPPYETKSRLMLITGHTSMVALEKYLRDIDAELPEDYSDLLL